MKPDLHPPAAPCDPSRPIKPKAQQSRDYCSETPDTNWIKQWNDCFFNKRMRGHALMCSSIRPYIHSCTYVTQGNVSTDLFILIMDNGNHKQSQPLSPGHHLPVQTQGHASISGTYESICGFGTLLKGTSAVLSKCSGTFTYYQNPLLPKKCVSGNRKINPSN